MDTKTLSQPEFDTLTQRLLQNLAVGAGEHKRARFHVDLNGSPDQMEIASLSYRGTIFSTDPEAKGKPFIKGQTNNEVRALLAAQLRNAQPLYLLQYDFTKRGSDWDYELKAQSCDEYHQMCTERRPLEDAVQPLLIAAAQSEMSDWKEVALSMDSIKKKLRVILRSPKIPLQDAAVTEEIQKAYEALTAFYASRGFSLDSFNLRLLGGPKKAIREVSDYYG